MSRRVLFVGSELHPPLSCMEARMVDFLAKSDEMANFRMRALSVRIEKERFFDPFFNYVEGPKLDLPIIRKAFYGFSFAKALKAEIDRGVDIVHFIWVGFPFLMPWAIRTLKKNEIQVIITILNQHSPPSRYCGADALIVHSNGTFRKYLQSGIRSNYIHLIRPPVDLKKFSPTYQKPSSYFVSLSGPRTLGQVSERGVPLLFKAFALLHKKKIPVRLKFFNRWAGGFDILERLRLSCEAYNVEIHHEFRYDINNLIAKSMGVIIPFVGNRIGDVPMSVIEAFACGRPAIVTRGLSIAEEVSQSGAGIVTSEDPKSIMRAVEKIIQAPFNSWVLPGIKTASLYDKEKYCADMSIVYRYTSR